MSSVSGDGAFGRTNSISSDAKEELQPQTAPRSNRNTVKGCGPIKATRKLDLSLVERLKEAGILPH